MKKRIKIIFLLLMFLPFIVNASSTINEGKTKANNYITSFENYKKYILFPTDSSKYAYEENGYNIVNGNGFLKGGFISAKEYRMSIHDGSSWLSPGISYWTLTKGSNNEYYYVSNSLFTKDMNEKLAVRVTEYVQPPTVIKGKGTTTNPWYFVEAFTVRLKSNNENYGNLLVNENAGEQILFVERHSTKSVNYTLTSGYDISKSNLTDCDTKYFSVNNNKLTIKSIDRDLNCIINFEPKKLLVKLDSTGGNITSNTLDVIFSQKYGEIPTPTKEGFIFEGWYTSSTGGTKITNETTVTETKDHTLYAQWRQEKIKCSELTYKCKNTSKGTNPILTYTGNCEVKCDSDNWKVKFLTSGDMTTTASLNIDVFLVGGGGGGYYSDGFHGENGYPYGGGGGYTETIKDVTYSPGTYNVVIGAGGGYATNGGQSKFDSYYAKGGYSGEEGGLGGSGGASIYGSGGRYGGNGAACNSAYPTYQPGEGGVGQGTTTCEFGEGTLKKCNGGNKFAYAGGGTAGGNSLGSYTPGGAGNCAGGDCGSGQANTGGGGAGHCCGKSTRGGSGVVIIRNKR